MGGAEKTPTEVGAMLAGGCPWGMVYPFCGIPAVGGNAGAELAVGSGVLTVGYWGIPP